MGQFTTNLTVQLINDSANSGRGQWQVVAPITFVSSIGVEFTVPVGFVTDFATIPRIPIVFDVFGDSAHGAATLHDWLYTAKPVPRPIADRVLLEAMECTGITKYKRTVIYVAVRLFGRFFW